MGKRRGDTGGTTDAKRSRKQYFQSVGERLSQTYCYSNSLHARACSRAWLPHTLQNSKACLPLGARGVLVSCLGGKEQYAGRDAVQILTRFYEQLAAELPDEPYVAPSDLSSAAPADGAPAEAAAPHDSSSAAPDGAAAPPAAAASAAGTAPAATAEVTDQPQDISAALAAEVASLKQVARDRSGLWAWDKTNVNGLIWVGLNAQRREPTPYQVVAAAARAVMRTKECQSRLCMRFMPMEDTCYASQDNLTRICGRLIQQHFPTGEDVKPLTFGIVFEHRASGNILKRNDAVALVGPLVPKPHKVKLDAPDKTILIEVIKNQCAVGILDGYKELGKMNLLELSLEKEEGDGQAAAEAPEAAKPATAAAKEAGAGTPAAVDTDTPADGPAETVEAAQAGAASDPLAAAAKAGGTSEGVPDPKGA